MGEDLPGISGQKAEQLVLDGGEMDLHPISIGTAGSIVDLQVPVLVEAGFLTYLLAVIADPAQATRSRARSSSTEKGLVR